MSGPRGRRWTQQATRHSGPGRTIRTTTCVLACSSSISGHADVSATANLSPLWSVAFYFLTTLHPRASFCPRRTCEPPAGVPQHTPGRHVGGARASRDRGRLWVPTL